MRAALTADADRGRDQPAPIIGRDTELAELDRALASPAARLVTVTGPPGVGKSRLVREAVLRSGPRFRDGVRRADLAPARTVPDALAEIARCCGLGGPPGTTRDPTAHLAARLRDQTVLLVLDGCEHLPGLGRELSRLLAAAPRTTALATSRARLRLAVETELALPPLAMPGPGPVRDLDRLAATPAVRLLVDRARLARPGFALDAANAAAVSALCVRADGLPLVIELLAARLATFSPAELSVRLRNREVLLDATAAGGPARHRSLRTAIAWSHDLLGPDARRVFRTVSVFPGRWTLAAAEQVLAAPDVDLLTATTTLVEQSLVHRVPDPAGPEAFRMLDSVREFAVEQLHRHGEEDAVRHRHAAYYAGLAVAAEAGFGTRDENLTQRWVHDQHADLRIAFDNALEAGDVASALPLAAVTGWYEFSHGFLGEGHERVERALAAARRAPSGSAPADLLAGALLAAGVLAESLHDLPKAEARLRETLRLCEGEADPRRRAVAHAFLGHVARHGRHHERAAREYTRALALHEAAGNHHGRAWSWFDLGLLALERGDLDTASSRIAGARAWFEQAGEAWPLAWALWALGETRLRQGSTDEAADLLAEGLDGYRALDDLRGVAQCVEGLAVVAGRRGACEAAARLLGAAGRVREWLHTPAPLLDATTVADTRTALAAELGAAAAERAVRVGATMPLDAALDLALAQTGRAAGTRPSPLTPRQREIAVLVAAGRTNRQIARSLGITEKTVEVHLTQAMHRLGARSRSQVAAHAVDAGLRGD